MALLTSPIVFAVFVVSFEWPAVWALLAALAIVVIFRGAVDVLAHKLIPAPAIYGAENELRHDDITSRRRVWYWSKKFRRAWNLFLVVAIAVGIAMLVLALKGEPATMARRLRRDARRRSRRTCRSWPATRRSWCCSSS